MNKKLKLASKKKIKSILSLILCMAILFSNTLVFAENINLQAAPEGDFVAVTIENYDTGKIILEPKLVEKKGNLLVGNALKYAYGEDKIVTDGVWAVIVKSVISPNEDSIANNDTDNWFVFTNSSKVGDLDATWEPGVMLIANDVVRLVYGNKDGGNIGLSGNSLSVNKDTLIFKLAAVTEAEKEDNNVKDVYYTCLDLIMDITATTEAITAAIGNLEAALSPNIPATSISISLDGVTIDETNINIGETIDLVASIEPANSTDSIVWESTESAIAEVDANGKVTGKSAGTVNITASAGNVSASVEITVKAVAVESISFEKETIEITQGQSKQLNLIVEPEGATDTITWTSGNSEIVSVDQSGKIIGNKVGSATITASVGALTASCNIEVGERLAYTEPTVVFHYKNGAIKEADENGEFTLSALDEGNFVLEGAGEIDFPFGSPYWECTQEVTEGLVSSTNIWVYSEDGLFEPHAPQRVKGKVFNQSPNNGGYKIKDFKINCIKTDIAELKGFVDGQEINQNSPYNLFGSESKIIQIKGRLSSRTEYLEIPVQALEYKAINKDYGYINKGEFGMKTAFGIPEDAVAEFEVSMKDKTADFKFKTISKKIGLENFIIKELTTAYIDKWNGLGERYIGVIPEITFTPENATNQKTIWESLDPEIAVYIGEHNAGIVPKKAGTARFKVTADDNQNLVQDVSIEFKYKNSLTNMTIEKRSITLEQYEEINLPIQASPENATEQRFNWSFDQDGIVGISDSIDNKDDYSQPVTTHRLTAKKIGTVKVTGTPIDDTANCPPIVFDVIVKEASEGEAIDYLSLAQENIKHGNKYIMNNPYSSYGYEWNLFTLIRTGADITKGDIDKYLTSASKVLKEDASLNPTDYARVALTLGAAGYKVDELEGIDLAKMLYSNEKLSNLSSNQVIWTLIALDSRDYNIPQDAKWTRNKIIEEILLSQAQDGGFSLSKNQATGGIDLTANAIQALVPYYKNSAKADLLNQISAETKTKIENSVERALEFLEGKMTGNGGFTTGGLEDSCAAAQVLAGITSLKIDPTDDERFTFGKKNIITNLDSFKLNEGFEYLAGSKKTDSMATIQTTYALNAYERFAKNQNSLYDLTDATGEDINPGEGTDKNPEDKPDGNPGNLSGRYGTISVTDPGATSGQTKVYFPQTRMELRENETAYSLLERTGLQLGVTTYPAYNGVYVKSINGFGEFDDGPLSGWMYRVNGAFPEYSSSLYSLNDGDSLEWVYTRESGKDVGGGTQVTKPTTEADRTVEPSVTIKGDNASVNVGFEDIKNAIGKAKEANEPIIIAPKADGTVKTMEVSISKEALSEITKQTQAPLMVETSIGKATISNEALSAILSQVKDNSVTISLEAVEKTTLTPEQQAKVEDKPVFDISITSGGKNISSFDGKNITVSLPYTLKADEKASDVKVWYLNDKGQLEEMKCTYDEKTGLATFTTNHLSKFMVGVETAIVKPVVTFNFTDVSAADWFYDAVKFAMENGLFKGTSESTFSPNEAMTRGMLVSVLHRMAGEPAGYKSSFTDVNENDWFAGPVAWAAANNVVSGYGQGLFGPNDKVTREQIAAILHRYAQSKGYELTKTKDLSGYKDASAISPWAKEVLAWANAEGLINGRSADLLAPGESVTRAEVAAILQRFIENVMK